jgi:hypothetical protein
MAIKRRENITFEYNTGDTLPTLTADEQGTLALDVDTEEMSLWNGTAWVPHEPENYVSYKASTDTFKLATTLDNQTQDLGQEMFFPAQNDTAESATELDPKVWLAGDSIVGDEDFFSILKPVSGDLSSNSQFGLNTTAITAAGGKGKIVVYGDVRGVNTSGWGPGSKLYLDAISPGELTSVPPDPAYYVAQVKKQDAVDGVLFVNCVHANPESTIPLPVSFLRGWFTGDLAPAPAGAFYITNTEDKGTVASIVQTILVDDNETGWVAVDTVGSNLAGGTFEGQVAGQVEFSVNTAISSEQIIVELYLAGEDGVVVDAGTGLPNGDLGVPPMVVLTSAILNVDDEFTFFAEVTGFIPVPIVIAPGQRVRFHIGATKVGTTGGVKTFSIKQGTDHDTFLFIELPVQAEDVAYDSSNSTLAATNVQSAIDELDDKTLFLTPDYVGGDPLIKNEMAVDSGWLGVALVATTDHIAPQPIGAPEGDLDGLTPTVASDISVVRVLHHYTFTKGGWAQSLSVGVPAWDFDAVTRIIVLNTTTNESSIYNNPVLNSSGFTILNTGNEIVQVGDTFTISFEFYNSSAASSVDGGWNSDIGTGTNALGQEVSLNDGTTPTLVSISHTDLDSGNRQAELDGVVVGSIIRVTETGDISRSVELEVITTTPGVGYTNYTVTTLTSTGTIRDARTCTVNIDVPITQPSEYYKYDNRYTTNPPSWATITTNLEYNGVDQGAPSDTAYGINLTFQEAYVSPDIKLLSNTSSTSGGGSADHPIKTHTTTGVALAAMSGGYVNISPDLGAGKTAILNNVIMRPVGGTVGSVDIRLIVTNISLGSSTYIIKEYTLLQGAIYLDPGNVIQFKDTVEEGAGLMFNTENFFKIHTNDAITGWDGIFDITIQYTEI